MRLGERQICGVSRISRTLTVNKDTFTCLGVEDEECMCYAISFNVERALVSLDEIIVIEQMLREILPLGTVDSFKCNNLKLLNVNLIRFTFKTYFVFYGYSPPKYSLN